LFYYSKAELEKEFRESVRHISVAIKVLNKKTLCIYIFRELITQTLVDHAHRNFPVDIFISNDLSTLYKDSNFPSLNPNIPSAEKCRNGRGVGTSFTHGDPFAYLQTEQIA
jgi:hypothetical protein